MLRASQLPKTIAIHWGVNGQVNGTTSLISFIIFFTLFNGAWVLLALTSCVYEATGKIRDPQKKIIKYVSLSAIWTTVCLDLLTCEVNIRSNPPQLDWSAVTLALAVGPLLSITLYIITRRLQQSPL